MFCQFSTAQQGDPVIPVINTYTYIYICNIYICILGYYIVIPRADTLTQIQRDKAEKPIDK